MRFIDTEGTGFHGVTVLIQTAKDDGKVNLFCPWTETIQDSIDFIEDNMLDPDGVVGFNWSFDQFHLQKLHSILCLAKKRLGPFEFMEDHIEAIAEMEPEARNGKCIRPYKVLDLMLHARKGPFQSLMNRKDIRIRSVPYVLAEQVREELNSKIVLPNVYFMRKADPTVRWQIVDKLNSKGEVVPDLVDIVLKFAPSASLKALAIATGVRTGSRALFDDIMLDKEFMSNELGWAPYATAPHKIKDVWVRPSPKNWYGRWPQWVHKHIDHWVYNYDARIYAEADVDDTRGLYNYFGQPELGDIDSELAAMVGSVRWCGFALNRPALQEQLDQATKDLAEYQFAFNSAPACRRLLNSVTTTDEQAIIADTSATTLQALSKWEIEEVCDTCFGMGTIGEADCPTCKGKGTVGNGERHAVAPIADKIIKARGISKMKGDLTKLLITDRFHPDFNVIGTKSSRMSGTGGLNAQGINANPKVRDAFTLADEGEELDGGDFESFEVTILDAEYNDPNLRADLLSGKKIHAVMAQDLFDKTYEEVNATKGLDGEDDLYARGKRSIFALAYGGDEGTLARKSGVSEEKAAEGYWKFTKRYPGLGEGRVRVSGEHTCLEQKEGGGRVIWKDPKEYVESMLGFKRYFTLEYQICKALFTIAENPPKTWDIKTANKVIRRDKFQTPLGATRTALFAAAFNIMSAVIRAALNHKIQSPGAVITKTLQKRLWDLQPCGVSEWKVRTMQVHDELLLVRIPELADKCKQIVDDFLVEYRKVVPLLDIDWKIKMKSWENTH